MKTEIKSTELRGKIEKVLEVCHAEGFDPFDIASDEKLVELLVGEGLITEHQTALRTLGRTREFATKILNSLLQHNPESTYKDAFINCLVFGVAIANPKTANPEEPVRVWIGKGPIFTRFKER